jgi:hypothetical protein
VRRFSNIIEAEPERLHEVTGIGLVRAKRIIDAWAEQKIIVILQPSGNPPVTLRLPNISG